MTSPLVFAHRGYTQDAAENTIEAFAAARRVGADGVELDVRRSADWALVVHHDGALAGEPIRQKAVRDLPAGVPLLAEALDSCQGMVVNVELKHDQDDDPDRALASAVAAAIVEAGWAERVVVSSFDAPSLDVVRDAGLAVGWLLDWRANAQAALGEAIERGYGAIHPFVAQVDDALVNEAHEAGLAVAAWTVNSPGDLAAMVELGVDSLITDRLVEALAAVRGPGRNGEPPTG